MTRAARRRAGALWMLGVSALAAPAAAAPSEAPAEVVFNAAQPDRWVVRYDGVGGGLLISDDAGGSWRLMCNDAIDTTLTRGNTTVAVSSAGDIFTGSLDGLWRVSDDGCRSTAEPVFADLWVSDLTVDPRDPKRLYAVTSSSDADNGLLRFDASAGTWEFLGAREPIAIGSVRAVAHGDGLRLYQSVLGSETTVDDAGTEQYQRFAQVRYSDDEGESWTSFRAFDGTQARTVTVAAVDPTDPDRIVVAESFGRDNAGRDRLWLNQAAGEGDVYQLLAELEWFGGAAFGPAGELWFADGEGAIFALAKGETEPVELVADVKARCLRYSAAHDGLLACQPVGMSLVEPDGSLRVVLDFRAVSEWVSCEGEADVPAQCEARLGRQDGWCSATHYPQAGVCAAYCYPGLDSTGPGAPPLPDDCSGGQPTDAGGPGPMEPEPETDAAQPAPTDAGSGMPSGPTGPTGPTDAGSGDVGTAEPSTGGGCQASPSASAGGALATWWWMMLGLWPSAVRRTRRRILNGSRGRSVGRHGTRSQRVPLFGGDKPRPSSAGPLK